ncbi:tryptophan halogenase family protein [Alteromonas sp. ASW11-130]|uniref:tryptophan halogenase family protein n=1 Tax=Alteromonas sp. ASW11-130 TaxID=3015775 RepID=UPI002241F919|nr:tryptophan halogenase family protein [Alteromonas sp. ASW11-130]MCW8092961.1 tryptophan 7-halogenase [Alteromonas sp. ASW11-130]
MNTSVKKILIVGGGSAGWLTAGLLAADYRFDKSVQITLVESPNVKHIGVGEGTWPSMRSTLERIGIRETDFIRKCNASFKQGSWFHAWRVNNKTDHYHHPFTVPVAASEFDIAPHWFSHSANVPFAHAVSAQPAMIEAGLAPKQITTPEYAFVNNYGYHLDAGNFVTLLQRHAVTELGVEHVLDDVVGVEGEVEQPIKAIHTSKSRRIEADLFIDCTGFASLLLGKHYNVKFQEQGHILFNDAALAAQVNYENSDAQIASATLSTAQSNGWIWDIGLQTRRGIGHVYSSAHTSDAEAERELREYIGNDKANVEMRKIPIRPGYRESFWRHNCVAVGMAAGFIEPLEASALVMVELAAKYISEQLPANTQQMAITAKRYNDTFTYRWQRIIDFLKLHYVLSERNDSQYWRDNRNENSIPQSLKEMLEMWRHHTPSRYDVPVAEELFPAASYQYVLYGMNKLPFGGMRSISQRYQHQAMQHFQQNAVRKQKLKTGLPTNRELLNQIQSHGMQTI